MINVATFTESSLVLVNTNFEDMSMLRYDRPQDVPLHGEIAHQILPHNQWSRIDWGPLPRHVLEPMHDIRYRRREVTEMLTTECSDSRALYTSGNTSLQDVSTDEKIYEI